MLGLDQKKKPWGYGGLVVLLAGAVLCAANWRAKIEPDDAPAKGRHNPQDFYLWSTGAAVKHTFRYDPRAADIWLFRYGSWLYYPDGLGKNSLVPWLTNDLPQGER